MVVTNMAGDVIKNICFLVVTNEKNVNMVKILMVHRFSETLNAQINILRLGFCPRSTW